MDRRSLLAAATAMVAGAAAEPAAGAADEVEAVKRRLVDFYRAFADPRVDRAYYLSFTTEDYLLCEQGELLDRAGDLAMLDQVPADQVRHDRFDFRRVTVTGDLAYAVYFLEADITDSSKGPRTRRWLESAVMRREQGQWRCAVLHSTRIATPAA